MFEPGVKDQAIDTTISNLILARLLVNRTEITGYYRQLTAVTEMELARELAGSSRLLKNYLGNYAGASRN